MFTPIAALSDKEITINKSKCVFAKKGASLLVIATKNNIDLNKLLKFNELAEDGTLGKNQYLFLQKKQKTGERMFCIVQPGETIYDIAQQNGVQLQYLLEYNNLSDKDVVVAGATVLLQPVSKTKKGSRDIWQPTFFISEFAFKIRIVLAKMSQMPPASPIYIGAGGTTNKIIFFLTD